MNVGTFQRVIGNAEWVEAIAPDVQFCQEAPLDQMACMKFPQRLLRAHDNVECSHHFVHVLSKLLMNQQFNDQGPEECGQHSG